MLPPALVFECSKMLKGIKLFIGSVPHKQLITAISGEHHFEALFAYRFHQMIQRQHRRIRQRFIQYKHDLINRFEKCRFVKHHFMMYGAYMLRHSSCKRTFIVLLIPFISYTKGMDWLMC